MSRISVVLPVYNGASHLREALDSILLQTLDDWELLVVNEYGSVDDSADIARDYAAQDRRIRLIQNTGHLGLAESLNLGIRESASDYIARMDADDLSLPERFRRQADFLDANPDVGICGTWQQHTGKNGGWVHRPPVNPERLSANLLFSCDLCHSTVMMRKSVLLKNGLFYDGRFAAEDYELWTRALCITKLANISEELGIYRYGGNISKDKMKALEAEHGELCATAMRRTLGLEIPEDKRFLLNAWTNIFSHERDRDKRREMLDAYAYILRQVWNANCGVNFFDEDSLLNTLRARWIWARWDLLDAVETAESIEAVFATVRAPVRRRIRQFLERNPEPGMRLRKILRWDKR